jgi:hypothetical protein
MSCRPLFVRIKTLKNASYPFPSDTGTEFVQLTSGSFNQIGWLQAGRNTEIKIIGLWNKPQYAIAFGDLNGDGAEDAAVILTMHTQDTTGRFRTLFAALNDAGILVPTVDVGIGDRDAIHDIRIANGKIEVDIMAQVGSLLEPGQKPGELFTKTYRLTAETKFVRVPAVVAESSEA